MSARWSILVLFFCVLSFFWMQHSSVANNENVATVATAFGEVASLVNTSVNNQDVVFVGDVMLGRHVATLMNDNSSNWPFKYTNELLEAGVTIGNFEAAIPTEYEQTPNFDMSLFVDTADLAGLVESGITHLSLANNHALDDGETGYQNTSEQLLLRGFKVAGHPEKITTDSILYFDMGDIRTAVFNLNASYYYPTEEEWLPVVSEMLRQSDLQIVYVHWGEEYESLHDVEQQELAHSLVDAGVDMVVGTHPHVVQDIERYDGALVFYSLGNFIFDQYFSEGVLEGLTLRLRDDEEGLLITLNPIGIEPNMSQPKPLVEEDRKKFLKSLAERSDSTIGEEIERGTLRLQF